MATGAPSPGLVALPAVLEVKLPAAPGTVHQVPEGFIDNEVLTELGQPIMDAQVLDASSLASQWPCRPRRFELRSKATGPHRVLRTDSSNNTIVIRRGREEERISRQHATPAPQVKSTSVDDDTQVSIDMPGTQPVVDEPPQTDFHVIDNVVGYRVRNGKPEIKIRWFNFGPQNDTWEPPNHIPRNFVVRYCKQRHIASPQRDLEQLYSCVMYAFNAVAQTRFVLHSTGDGTLLRGGVRHPFCTLMVCLSSGRVLLLQIMHGITFRHFQLVCFTGCWRMVTAPHVYTEHHVLRKRCPSEP